MYTPRLKGHHDKQWIMTIQNVLFTYRSNILLDEIMSVLYKPPQRVDEIMYVLDHHTGL